MEKWLKTAEGCGFTHAAPVDVATLRPMAAVRDMCAADKCRAYGKNWTCPPHCGTLEQCGEKIHSYSNAILLQTAAKLEKRIDTKGYAAVEKRHLESFREFCRELRSVYPDALCLGAGGCRICGSCAFPETCRFPEEAMPSMEGYGLFVTQVCRDNGIAYYHGEKTIAYFACVLF